MEEKNKVDEEDMAVRVDFFIWETMPKDLKEIALKQGFVPPEGNMIIVVKTIMTEQEKRKYQSKSVDKVYAVVAWHDNFDEKYLFLFKTEELAEKLAEKYEQLFEHVYVQEMEVYDSNHAEAWTI